MLYQVTVKKCGATQDAPTVEADNALTAALIIEQRLGQSLKPNSELLDKAGLRGHKLDPNQMIALYPKFLGYTFEVRRV